MQSSRNIRRYASAMAVLLASVLFLTACGSKTTDTPADSAGTAPKQEAEKPKQVIKLADLQWQSLWINNAIAGFIIKNGYGYPIETVEMTTPIMQQALVKGDIDVVTEMWTGNIIEWYKEVQSKKQVIDLGPVMDRAVQGWYVPAYMVKGDAERGIKATAPDLKSVADLEKYIHLFPDPEEPSKGLMFNCITGWECAKINRIKLQAYGLSDVINVQEPGASAALDAAIAGAYKKGEPFFTYYWEPTWLVGTYDMILLEEPAFTAECNANIQKALHDEVAVDAITSEFGCAYEDALVTKAVTPALKERAPEVVTFLEKFSLKTDDLNKVSSYMELEKKTADEAAAYFFKNYPDVWKSWVPADIAAKVESALK